MKLAEALVLRADLKKRIEQIRTRLNRNALIQEGEQPSENPQELLAELTQLLTQLQELITRINTTNLTVRLADGTTLTEALSRRDILSLHYNILSSLADTASNRLDRHGLSEIRSVATVNVAELRRQSDKLAQQRRELDTAIQFINWTAELQ